METIIRTSTKKNLKGKKNYTKKKLLQKNEVGNENIYKQQKENRKACTRKKGIKKKGMDSLDAKPHAHDQSNKVPTNKARRHVPGEVL